ncbi:MAG: bifunctional hydroxymethylpyrimidine kinase/phosphomethylpyrimidine kinase [Paracoccus sp. (in: a-proteobacteria)]|nr:bifunctional hydroxymethylpyrimidine kinase/phosphomethylpyrimidine kinase [Paracoccus sp. (in: a-proteobacteria)]
MIANILSIAGTDPTGGAGIHADLKTFAANGAYGMAAVTAVVAQNTQGVRGFAAIEPAMVADQIDAVFEDVRVDAVKIGMCANAGIIEAIANRLTAHQARNIVLDPVMVAKSGDHLLAPEAVAALRERLVPMATVITPNLPEAAVLLGVPDAWDAARMEARLGDLLALGSEWVLLKGGHLAGETATDLLAGADGITRFAAPRIATRNDHGTGCTLSAAIAAHLPALGVVGAVGAAKDYLQGALAAADQLQVGHGHGPLNHMHGIGPQPGPDGCG